MVARVSAGLVLSFVKERISFASPSVEENHSFDQAGADRAGRASSMCIILWPHGHGDDSFGGVTFGAGDRMSEQM